MKKVLAMLALLVAVPVAWYSLRSIGIGTISLVTDHSTYGITYGFATLLLAGLFGALAVILVRWGIRTIHAM